MQQNYFKWILLLSSLTVQADYTDSRGYTWLDIQQDHNGAFLRLNLYDAKAYCGKLNAVLPSNYHYDFLREELGFGSRKGYLPQPGYQPLELWTQSSETQVSSFTQYYSFNQMTGSLQLRNRDAELPFQCIAAATANHLPYGNPKISSLTYFKNLEDYFTPVNVDLGVSGWRDPSGLIWFSVGERADRTKAKQICRQADARLPRKTEADKVTVYLKTFYKLRGYRPSLWSVIVDGDIWIKFSLFNSPKNKSYRNWNNNSELPVVCVK